MAGPRILRLGFTLALVAAASAARAQDPPPATATATPPAPASPDVRDLARKYELLLQNQRRLEERLAQQEPPGPRNGDDVARSEGARLFGLGPDGFFIGSRDTFQIRVRALIQADGRAFFAQTPPIADTFLIRRARPILEGTVGNFIDFMLVPDFAGGAPTLFDAFVDFRPWKWLALRGGKFKTPFGLERLQQDRFITFIERGLPSNLAPDRDVGASLHGNVADGSLLYELAILDGTADGASVDTDTNDPKDYVARLFSHPFRKLRSEWLKYFGVGGAFTWGKQKGNPITSGLVGYKTAGQNTFFTYVSDTTGTKANAIALGDRWRATAQAYYYGGPFGLLAEYVFSSTNVSTFGNPGKTIANHAWQVEASWVVTGEHAAYDGVWPKNPFNVKKRHFGAVEVGARYGELRVDAAAFPAFADPAKSARAALAWGVVANWYFTHETKFGLLFERTTFTGGGGATGDRAPENALIGRLQAAF